MKNLTVSLQNSKRLVESGIKIIFLDIDGVLNRLGTMEEGRTTTEWNGYIGMEPELVERFNKLCADTHAKVVLSSTWRKSDTWLYDMRHNGLLCDFRGRTPQLTSRVRGEEIKDWLDKNPSVKCNTPTSCPYPCRAMCMGHNITKYVIIDDDSDMLPEQKESFFKTSYKFGLTQEIADKIEIYLKANGLLK